MLKSIDPMPSTEPNSPLVSIIVCFLNPGTYLDEAIQSVWNQTYRNWELILVDDGSTDESTERAREAAFQSPRQIRYAEHAGHANRGKSTSRNLGLKIAEGELIVFLDADDILLPTKLEHQVATLQRHPEVDLVYGRTRFWFPPSNPENHNRKDYIQRLWVRWDQVYSPPELLVRYLEQPGSVPCLCAPLIRRRLIDRTGAFDESIQHLYEDQVLLAKLAVHGVTYVDLHVGENYRQHAASSCAQAIQEGEYHPSRMNPARKQFLEWLTIYVDSSPAANHPQLRRALRHANFPFIQPRLYRWLQPIMTAWTTFRNRAVARLFPEPTDDSSSVPKITSEAVVSR